MTLWYHQPTILGVRSAHVSRRRFLQIIGILAVCVALITTLFFANVSRAEAGTNKTLGFQGRLLDSNGNTVPDGYYNMQFRIYQGGTGANAGNTDGTLVWTESYINNGNASGAVEVKAGLLSVNLGSRNPFGTAVDWNDDTLWLSMNVAGRSTSCTTFGTAPCLADGEMLPMKRLTASPYALNSGALEGKSASNFIQLAQGVQNDASTNTSSIFINKTGTGNLIQLQSSATDIFTVTNSGDLTFGNNANHTISVSTAGAGTSGRQLSVVAGNGGSGTGSAGGDLVLQGGAAGGTNGDGGNVQIDAGAKTGTGGAGSITIGSVNAGSITIGSTTAGADQNIVIGTNGTANSGTTTVQGKSSVIFATDGTTRATFSDDGVYFGNGVTAAQPDDYKLQGTGSTADGVDGGNITLQGGNATTGDANGGNITLSGGVGSGDGANGLVVLGTPTFSTTTNDANCYTDGASVEASCTVTSSTVNNSAAVILGFSAEGQTATLPDPTIQTAGRILYVTAAGDTEDFLLAINGGGEGNELRMQKNATATLLWNGTDWTVAGTANTSSIFKVGRAGAAPVVTDEDAMLGSMYYDVTLGKLQCYEADGWGACSSSPDIFITLSPEFSNAVENGDGDGTMTSDLCSDTLNINDGSNNQPVICGTNETFNFYNWTSSELTEQTRSIYVTYQLPGTFKEFAADATSLMGRTDGNDAAVSYQIYRNNSTSGLTACGGEISVSTGAQSTWQKATADGLSDPADCDFEAGDSIVFKINLSASADANAYVSNLNFTYANR